MSPPGVPPLPTWLVPRPRLTDRLSLGVLGPLTVVVGPVGAGKSALAVEWAHTRRAPGPVAWVTCDGAEEQPDVFWPRVLAALREASVELPALPPPPTPRPTDLYGPTDDDGAALYITTAQTGTPRSAGPYTTTGQVSTDQDAGPYATTGQVGTDQETGPYATTGQVGTARHAEVHAATGVPGATGQDGSPRDAGLYDTAGQGGSAQDAGGCGVGGQDRGGGRGAGVHGARRDDGTAGSYGGGVPGAEVVSAAGPYGGRAGGGPTVASPDANGLDGPPLTRTAAADGLEPHALVAAAGPPGTAAAGQSLLVAALAAGLAARQEPVVLVLDDFQPESGSPVAEGMVRLLRHATPALRLVVVSRRDPPLHLHRYRLAGDLTELRTGDLAFDDRETAALLAQHGVEVPRPVVRTLRERADGWAAGLRLAAMSMQRHPHPERFVARFAGEDEAIVSYLVEEVLDGQPPAMRRLLLTTSVLDHLNAELATQVAGQEAGRHFAALVAQSSFLQHTGHGWYRCHRMFGDVLRVRLRHEAPDLVPALHARAAEWLGEHGLLAEAVRHALAADDLGYADRLVVHQLAIGQVLALTSTRLPGELLTRTTPADSTAASREALGPESALVTSAAALARGDGPACTRHLALADRLIGDLPGDATDRIARCRLAHSVIRMARDRPRRLTAARAAAAEAERLFPRLPRGLLEDRPELVALTLSVRGRAELREGDLKAAEASLTAALKAACAAENGVLRRDCLSELALLEVLRGRFRAADQFAGHARHPVSHASSEPDPSLSALHVVRAWIGLTRLDAQRARGELSRAHATLRQVPDPFVTGVGSLVAKLVAAVETGPARPEALDTIPDLTADGWLAEGLRQSVRHACAATLGEARARRLRPAPGTRGTPDPRPRDDRPPVESLSTRERDVLRHLAQMMTTEEIADELYVSVNTVKTHLKSVYRKLAVTRRSAAVRRARELELL
ncbi:LuxR C-terminal-related transcriptional regulator [Streptomyces sp. FR-108]|uniref:helix-turn-helix transcriptional regulator n=1 Tax=Streptomyces sp. FR-108 TaxID=3416665 RepID=UPI003CEEC89C